MSDDIVTQPTEQLCGHCGFPIHRDDSERRFGTYAAHKEYRCHQLLKAEIERLRVRDVWACAAIKMAFEDMGANDEPGAYSVLKTAMKRLT